MSLPDGQTVQFSTNRNNNISMVSLERFLRRKVAGLQVQGEWGGFRELEIIKGYITCPPVGWGEDRVYRVLTQEQPGS